MQPERAPSPAQILIVEDNQVNAIILRAMLRKHGFEPIVAIDGREGIEMTGRHHPRLVFMDLHMPRLDGFSAARRIRASAGEVPILVATTASFSGEVHTACHDAGFSCVLTKPIIYEDLIAVVCRYLDA